MSRITMNVGFNGTDNLTGEDPFLDKFKQGGAWNATTSSGYTGYGMSRMDLDSNGYPQSMNVVNPPTGETFSRIGTAFNQLQDSPFYRSGKWVCLWNGTATSTSFSFNAIGDTYTTVFNTNNRAIYNVATPSNAGVRFDLSGISSLATVTKLQWVYGDIINSSVDVAASSGTGGSTVAGTNGTGTYEAQLNSGMICDPDWKRLVQPFSAFRVMQWWLTNDGARPGTYAGWATPAGYVFWNNPYVPVEVCVAVANEIPIDLWVTVPPTFDYADLESFSNTLLSGSVDGQGRVWSGLNISRNLYVEAGNEVWLRTNYWWSSAAAANAALAFPNDVAPNSKQNDWGRLTGVQYGNTIKRIFTTASSSQGNQVKRVACGVINGALEYWYGSDPSGPFVSGAYHFAGTGHISGTTFTVDSISSGNVSLYQEILSTSNSVLSKTYISGCITSTATFQSTVVGTQWSVNRSQTVGSSSSPAAVTGAYWYGTVAQNVDYGEHAPYMNPSGTAGTQQDVFDYWWNQGPAFINASISGTTMTVSTAGGIRLFPGQAITAGAAPGTIITNQLTATNPVEWAQAGTYTVNISQSVTASSSTIGVAWGDAYSAVARCWADSKGANFNYGLPILCYEGGEQLFSGSTNSSGVNQQQLYIDCKSNSSMYDTYTNLLNYMQGSSVTTLSTLTSSNRDSLFMAYASFGPFTPSVFGNFNCIPNVLTSITAPSAYEYKALYDFQTAGSSEAPAPPAPGGGTTIPSHGFHFGRVKGPRRQIPHV